MHDASSAQCDFEQALPHVEAVLRYVARRHHLSEEEAEELAGNVRLRLIEDEYRVIRLFEGRSQLRTYLTTVITRLVLDERVKAWGKWRPSAEAKRLGPLAESLERLIGREHLTTEEAVETLCSRDPACTRAMLMALLERLPHRSASRRHVDETALETVADCASTPESDVAAQETREAWVKARAALADVLRSFPPRDGLLIELRYFQGSRVSDIAKVVREDQKTLYRRYEQLLTKLRRALEERGLSRALLGDLFREGAPDDTPEEPPLRIVRSPSVSQDDEGAYRDTAAG